MRYAIARDVGRVRLPNDTFLPVERADRPPTEAVILPFLPPAAPSVSVGAPRTVIPPTPVQTAVLSSETKSSGVPAVSVGVRDGGGTKLSMLPADLWDGPRTDISQFVIISIAAGSWT